MTGDRARGHGAATLFEAARLGCACDPAIRSPWPGARLAGAAFTVQGMGGDNLALHSGAPVRTTRDVSVIRCASGVSSSPRET